MDRILIVDDDTDLLFSLKSFLTKNGYEVTTTTSCNDAMRVLISFSPQLVLLDINVGDEDGRAVCKQIKSQAESKHIPVILISANQQMLDKYQDYDADASLPKPFDLMMLLNTIEKTIKRSDSEVEK